MRANDPANQRPGTASEVSFKRPLQQQPKECPKPSTGMHHLRSLVPFSSQLHLPDHTRPTDQCSTVVAPPGPIAQETPVAQSDGPTVGTPTPKQPPQQLLQQQHCSSQDQHLRLHLLNLMFAFLLLSAMLQHQGPSTCITGSPIRLRSIETTSYMRNWRQDWKDIGLTACLLLKRRPSAKSCSSTQRKEKWRLTFPLHHGH